MQVDMHYYGVYALARAAGMKSEFAKIVATASQFVDDNVEKGDLLFKDGGRLDFEATAHHYDDSKNVDKEDQRQIWVPFHFLPSGKEDNEYSQRMICQKEGQNNPVLAAVKSRVLELLNERFSLSVVGIFAHIYADTFSHCGFSGFSNHVNKIKNSDVILENYKDEVDSGFMKKLNRAWQKCKSYCAERLSKALGHGAVLSYPDLPYLTWSFVYQDDDSLGILTNSLVRATAAAIILPVSII